MTMEPDNVTKVWQHLISFIDLTSLSDTDNEAKIKSLCKEALAFREKGLPAPAAVCTFMPFLNVTRKMLAGSGIRVAVVAGGFPHGQIPTQVKLDEIKYAVDGGAEEIDVVFSRGLFLSGQHHLVFDELAGIREHSRPLTLKVILETSDLQLKTRIIEASHLALNAGADFIKTSTGKSGEGATIKGIQYMIHALSEHFRTTGRRAGIKPSGGISEPEEALSFYQIIKYELGDAWMTPETFRIGASRLAGKLAERALKNENLSL
jgi:deoxyribose-phosphate aldolase